MSASRIAAAVTQAHVAELTTPSSHLVFYSEQWIEVSIRVTSTIHWFYKLQTWFFNPLKCELCPLIWKHILPFIWFGWVRLITVWEAEWGSGCLNRESPPKPELWLCTTDSGLYPHIKQAVPGTLHLPHQLCHPRLNSLQTPEPKHDRNIHKSRWSFKVKCTNVIWN